MPEIGNYYSIHGLKNFKGKLTTHWLGPYEVVTYFDNGSEKLKQLMVQKFPL